VGNGDSHHLPWFIAAGEGQVGALDPQKHLFTGEVQVGVGQKRPWQQPGLGEHLKAIADTHHRVAPLGQPPHLLHHGRKLG